jgi:nitrile hydratase
VRYDGGRCRSRPASEWLYHPACVGGGLVARRQEGTMIERDRQSDARGAPPLTTSEPDVAYLKKQVMALVGLLGRKKILRYAEFLDEVHRLEAIDHAPGARLVARAWSDRAFKERLLGDPKAAVAELGIDVGGSTQLQVVENTPQRHHVVVCTTCSCVPSPFTGTTPDWYKSTAYRTRVVNEPREVLREFGLVLPETTEVQVIDTDQAHRCLVLPRRPAETEGLSETQLAALVTQESLFGVGEPRTPAEG